MAADAHVTLRRGVCEDPANPLTFSEMYRYGTSKMNQRIEGIWRQLLAATKKWRECFYDLWRQSLFDRDNKYDRIAMLFVYMPTIRFIVKDKIDRWNKHKIRKQKVYPDAIIGVPEMMYKSPELHGAEHHAIRVNASFLADMKADLEVFHDFKVCTRTPTNTTTGI